MTEQQFDITDNARAYLDKLLGEDGLSLAETDPEFAASFANFAFDELVTDSDIDERRRFLAIIAATIGAQGFDTFKIMVAGALNFGVDPVEIKEVIYQAVAYTGLTHVLPYLKAANEIFVEKGIELPLAAQKTVDEDTRLRKGNDVQIQVFGEGMRDNWKTAPEPRRVINEYTASNCFGDYYTRTGLSLADRELVTFCFIVSLGGAHPQAISHAIGNIKIGNSAVLLRNAVHQLVPYIGYPRSLNALAAIDNASAAIFEDEQANRAMKKF